MLKENIPDGPSTISILLTTDNHVGFAENDPIRGDDAWCTFDEICRLARDRDVDMLVQGGDLFHINKPSKKSMFHVMKLLRENCMGDRPVELEMVSDPETGLSNGLGRVNYEDPNLNILVPVFAIAGNHDDSTGDAFLSPMDVLAMSGLVNHFGKITDNENITVLPLLFRKGSTSLALYGMGNVRDERLHRSFRDGQVKFQRPINGNWFNMLVFHQNHAQHTFTSSIPEAFLPLFLDFILWGHEHECLPYPSHNPETGFDVLLGGSSVATSLSEGEVAHKCVYIMKVCGQDYSVEAIPLTTVRPFVLRDISLLRTNLVPGVLQQSDVAAYLTEEVESMIREANGNRRENNGENDNEGNGLNNDGVGSNGEKSRHVLPLIRLKVEYTGFDVENARRFSNRFVGRVANANDCVHFYRKKTGGSTSRTKFVDTDLFEAGASSKKSVEVQLNDIMNEFLLQAQLSLLPETGLNSAVQRFVQNEDKHVLDQFVKKEIKNECAMLMKLDVDSESSDNQIQRVLKGYKESRPVEEEEPAKESTQSAKKQTRKRPSRTKSKKSAEIVESDEEPSLRDAVMGF